MCTIANMGKDEIINIPLGKESELPRAAFSDRAIGYGGGWVSDGTWMVRGDLDATYKKAGPFNPPSLADSLGAFIKIPEDGELVEIRRWENNTYTLVGTHGSDSDVKLLNDRIINYISAHVPGIQWFHGMWNSWKHGPAYGIVQGTPVALVMPMRRS